MQTGGISIFRFVTIALYTLILFGLFINLGKALIEWNQTGDYKPTVEATLGQVFYWDNQIYEGVDWLRNTDAFEVLPPSFANEFKKYVVQQIVFYLMMFIIIGFLFFKLGNWIAGQASLNPATDLIIIAVIVLAIFPLGELAYGRIMHDEWHMPYRGIAQLVKVDTWKLMLGDGTISNEDLYGKYATNMSGQNKTSYYIDLS